MSSISIRKPEFRLLLGYPDVILEREGAEEPVGTAAPGSERFGADLRRLAGEVLRAGGRLTVVLPASEVWRGQVEPEGRAPRAEWRAARDRAAAALGVPADALKTVVGRRAAPNGARGLVPAAAVRRSTLAEVRALLASVGLRPSAIVGAGAFDGFAAAPRLCGRWTPAPVGRRRAIAGAGGLAFAALALMVMALRPEPAAVAPSVVAVAPAIVAPAAPRVDTAAVPAAKAPVDTAPAPVRIARVDPPAHRPEAALIPAGAALAPIATIGTRNVPVVVREEKGKPVVELRLAELPNPRAPLTDAAVPLPRPAGRAATKAAAAGLGPVPDLAPDLAPDLRPAHRPGAAPARTAPAPKAAAVSAATGTSARPMPRPEAEPVRVASLGNQVSDAVIAAAVLTPLTPLARPEAAPVRTAAPAPKADPVPVAVPVAAKAPAPKVVAAVEPRAVPVKPKVVAPAPKVAAAPLAPRPTAQPVRQAVAKPTVQRVVRVEEKRPAAVARAPAKAPAMAMAKAPAPKAKPATAPVRVAAAAPAAPAPTVRRQGAAAGFFGLGKRGGRTDLALVGVFGGSKGRSALIQMPNGKIQKVSAGDRVQGMQVAAIGSDSVRVTDGKRETTLTLPE